MNPTKNVDEHTIRPYTTYGGGGEFENVQSSATPRTEKRQSDKTINDSRSTSDQRPSLDSSLSIPQEPARPNNLDIGRQRPESSSTSPLTVSSTYGNPKQDRECANLSQRPYTHSGLNNEYHSSRNKEKLSFFDMSSRATRDETRYLLSNSWLSNRSPRIDEIQHLESTLNTTNPGAKTQEKRTTILASESSSPTTDTISLGQRPLTSPSQFNGSSIQSNLQMQNQQYTVAPHMLSTSIDSSVPDIGDVYKFQSASDHTAHQN